MSQIYIYIYIGMTRNRCFVLMFLFVDGVVVDVATHHYFFLGFQEYIGMFLSGRAGGGRRRFGPMLGAMEYGTVLPLCGKWTFS